MAKKKTTKRTTKRRTKRRPKGRQSGWLRRRGWLAVCLLLIFVCLIGYSYIQHPEVSQRWKKGITELIHPNKSQQPLADDAAGDTSPGSSPSRNPEPAQTNRPDRSEIPENTKDEKTGSLDIPKKTVSDFKDLEFTYLRESRKEQVLRRTGFVVSYNEHWRQPNWVGYELTREKTGGKAKRYSRFYKDPHVEGICPIHNDYTKTGYDRGHMAPAADMAWSEESMKESFYLSNICPQHPDLNRRKWKELEDRVRDWAIADSAIVVVCGPVIADRCETIGKNMVAVPHQFFKVILSPYTDPPRAIGFLFDNQRATGSLQNYAVTVDSVERVTGLNFFSSLPDEIEEFVESVFDAAAWGI